MFCGKCGKQIPDDSDFCPKCGAKMIAEALDEQKIEQAKPEDSSLPVCSKCGKPIPTGNMFCPSCGADIPSVEIVSEKVPAPKKRSKKGVIIGIVAAVAVAVFAAIFIPIQVNVHKNPFPEFEYHLDDGGRYTIDGYVGEEKDIVIPNTIKGKPVYAINECAFSGKDIKSVKIGSCTRIIGGGAFRDCLSLETVSFSEYSIQIAENLVFFNQAFKNCSNLKSVKLPSTGVHIFDEAFYGCRKLSEIDLFKVLSIKDSAFENCSDLSIVHLGDIEFTPRCFANCNSLLNVICDSCGDLIAREAFSGCTQLKSFAVGLKTYRSLHELENSGVIIGIDAFEGCDNFKDSEPVTPVKPVTPTSRKLSDYVATDIAKMTYETFINTFGDPEESRFGSAYYDGVEVKTRSTHITDSDNRGLLDGIVVFGGKERVVIDDVHLGEGLDYYNARLSFDVYDALEIGYEIQGLGTRYELPVEYTMPNGDKFHITYRFNADTMISNAAEVEYVPPQGWGL